MDYVEKTLFFSVGRSASSLHSKSLNMVRFGSLKGLFAVLRITTHGKLLLNATYEI